MTIKFLTTRTPTIPRSIVAPPKAQFTYIPVDPVNKQFCYWTVAAGEKHSKMMETCIKSARIAGVDEDFHVWTDHPWNTDERTFLHPVTNFKNDHYMFKFEYLNNEVSLLEYESFVWLDADNYFVRKPPPFIESFLRENKWFVQLESNCVNDAIKRADWWGIPIKWYPILMRYMGVDRKQEIYNTNAGFWIVRKTAIEEFYDKTLQFFKVCNEELKINTVTEEVALAFVGHLVDSPFLNTFANTKHVWASDWVGPSQFGTGLPKGDPWIFQDYMTDIKETVNPHIVHVLRSKDALIAGI